jgi:hypothetical protein
MRNRILILTVHLAAKRATVVLKLSKKTVTQLITDAKSYEDAMTKNVGTFPNPNPAFSSIDTLIINLQAATVAAKNHAKGTTAARNVARKALENALRVLAHYFESVANSNPENAEVIVQLANMSIRTRKTPGKNDFNMLTGKNAGELIMLAKSEKGSATYNFEISTDISNAANWKSVQNKTSARAVITGLITGTRYFGRVSRSDKTGTFQIGTVLSAFAH